LINTRLRKIGFQISDQFLIGGKQDIFGEEKKFKGKDLKRVMLCK
jgi:hypothetical protein